MAKIAIVGTGFVADYYLTTLVNHPDLELLGVFDRDAARLERFASFHQLRAYESLKACLADGEVEILVNLTTPESHYEINCAALAAGKHVYCEKPLAMTAEQVIDVVVRAKAAGLHIATAPANALSEAQALTATLIEQGKIGRPRLAYAEMEDGPVFRDNWREWRSLSGAPWPGLHEFEVGCTLEHAGYGLSWLVSLFGPVSEVQAFSALAFPEKGPGTGQLDMGPDFSVGCLSFGSGMVARLTCGLAAPRDRSLTIIGDEGMIVVRDLWDHRSPVHLSRFDEKPSLFSRVARRIERMTGRSLPIQWTGGRTVRYPRGRRRAQLPAYPSQIDFAGGIAAMAGSISRGEIPQFSDNRAAHLSEIVLAISNGAGRYSPRTTF